MDHRTWASSGRSPGNGDGVEMSPGIGTGSTGGTPVGGNEADGVSGVKRQSTAELEAASPDSAGRKRKKTGPGMRGVANLTPEQLAKKRANDREAQRAIRERTKNQIENLERRIQQLTNQKPYQELQVVLRAKEAVEQENASIKQRLASVIGILQSVIGPGPVENAYIQPESTQTYAQPLPTQPQTTDRRASVSTPTDSTTSRPNTEQRFLPHPWQAGQRALEVGPGSGYDTQQHAAEGSQQQSDHLHLQRQNLRHGLDMGPERLELDFVLHPKQRPTRIQNGINGAQDTPQFHHVPMKHDWTAVSNDQALHARPHAWESPVRIEGHMTGQAGGSSRQENNTIPDSLDTMKRDHNLGYGINDVDPRTDSGLLPRYAAPTKNSEPTCPLDSLLLDFLCERRQRAAQGLPTHEVIGPRYPSVSSLLNPANSVYSHPLSKVFTDILSTFPDISTIPERVAVLYVMFLVMRWQVSPTRENYERLPEWMLPSDAQISRPHPAWIDYLPFPIMRDKIAREYNPTEYLFDNFFIPYTTTLTLSWPYEEIDTLLQSPDSDELMINPVFERHLRNLDNWKLGDAFVRAFPTLTDTFNLDSRPVKQGTTASTMSRPTSSSSRGR